MAHAFRIQNLLALFAISLVSCALQAQSLDSLMTRCAPNVHPVTLAALIRTESGGNAYALSDDGLEGLPWAERKKSLRSYSPATLAEAEAIASALIAQGHLVGIGLTQVSSRNLARFNLTVRDALDPCVNVRTGGQILAEFYRDALPKFRDTNSALLAALSAYNTGNFSNGFTNGYVSRVVEASMLTVPALRTNSLSTIRARVATVLAPSSPRAAPERLLSQKFAVLRASIE